MSLINDALKQARQAPPRNTPSALPPLQPAHNESPHTAVWLVPAVIIFLVFAAIFFIGWAAAHRTVHTIVSAPTDPATTQAVEVVNANAPIAAVPEPPVKTEELPRLQGIFYSPTAPSAIMDGKTIRPGDQFKQYKVKEITKFNVILVTPDKKELKIGLGG
jgi:hypothetical protein